MKMTSLVKTVAVVMIVPAFTCFSGAPTDAVIRQGIMKYLAPRCGGMRGENAPADPELADYLGIEGETNRLARILAEVAQTSNAWYSGLAMGELEKYGTVEQLPFLYSCATNPASWAKDDTPTIGDRAMKAVLRIEGVSSNSVALLRQYLLAPKQKPFVDWDRCDICKYFVSMAKSTTLSSEGTNGVMSCLLQYAPLNNVCPKELDSVIISYDPSYSLSQRRLAVFRAVNNLGVDEFETSYVTNAINELVAYPEANLPD